MGIAVSFLQSSYGSEAASQGRGVVSERTCFGDDEHPGIQSEQECRLTVVLDVLDARIESYVVVHETLAHTDRVSVQYVHVPIIGGAVVGEIPSEVRKMRFERMAFLEFDYVVLFD